MSVGSSTGFRVTLGVATLVVAITVGSCAGGDSGAVATPTPPQKTVTVKSGEPSSAFSLHAGRYRAAWDATGCTGFTFDLKQQDGSFTYQKVSRFSKQIAFISDVPEGMYILTVETPCATWLVTLDHM